MSTDYNRYLVKNISVQSVQSVVEIKNMHSAWEHGLPEYLQHDLDAYKEGLKTNSTLLDCLWCELYGSINGAELDDQAISHEQAQYLRDKFLWHKTNL